MFRFSVRYQLNGERSAMPITGKDKWDARKRFERKYPTIAEHAENIFVAGGIRTTSDRTSDNLTYRTGGT